MPDSLNFIINHPLDSLLIILLHYVVYVNKNFLALTIEGEKVVALMDVQISRRDILVDWYNK